MNKYKVLIIDDELTAREILEQHLSKIDVVQVVGSCKNAMDAFSLMHETSIDLVFLDINMPEVSGLMFAKAMPKGTKVIFTTAYREYAVDGFDLQAVDYLLKPISLERLLKSVNKFKNEVVSTYMPEEQLFTFFRCDRKMVKVVFDELLYIESFGDYLKLHTQNGILVTRETMQEVLQKLPLDYFIRAHRSFIFHLNKVDSYTNEHITIGRNAIPISRNYKTTVLQLLNGYAQKRRDA